MLRTRPRWRGDRGARALKAVSDVEASIASLHHKEVMEPHAEAPSSVPGVLCLTRNEAPKTLRRGNASAVKLLAAAVDRFAYTQTFVHVYEARIIGPSIMPQFRMNENGIAPAEKEIGGLPRFLVRIAVTQLATMVLSGIVMNITTIAVYGWDADRPRQNFTVLFFMTAVGTIMFLIIIGKLAWLNLRERLAKRRRLAGLK